MPVLRPSGSDFTSFVKAAAQYVPSGGAAAKPSKSGGVVVAKPGLGAVVRTSQVGALASPTTSAVVINGVTPPASGGGGAAAAAGFNPTGITGLAMWMDATDPLGTGTQPANGTAMTSWFDRTGNLTNMTAPNGLVSYSNTGLNGRPALVFSNNSAYLSGGPYQAGGSYIDTFQNNKQNTFFMVAYMPGYTSANSVLQLGTTKGEAYRPFQYLGQSFGVRHFTLASDWIGSFAPYNGDTTFLYTSYNDGSTMGSAMNGATTYTTNTVYPFAANSVINQFLLYGPTTVSELVMYNTVLSIPERQKVEGYLAWKWGLQANLPAGHPYKTAAPV